MSTPVESVEPSNVRVEAHSPVDTSDEEGTLVYHQREESLSYEQQEERRRQYDRARLWPKSDFGWKMRNGVGGWSEKDEDNESDEEEEEDDVEGDSSEEEDAGNNGADGQESEAGKDSDETEYHEESDVSSGFSNNDDPNDADYTPTISSSSPPTSPAPSIASCDIPRPSIEVENLADQPNHA